MGKTIRLGNVFGIEIRLDSSWFVLFALVTWSLAGHYLMSATGWAAGVRWTLGMLTALVFFASILLHELGHSLVANALGTPVRSITLFVFGGIAEMAREPKRARHEFLIVAAGPVVSLALGAIFAVIWLLGARQGLPSVAAMSSWLASTNVTLAVFNLIPGFPLDGGRIVRAILWGVSGNQWRATRAAATIGQGVAVLFMLLGLWRVVSGAGLDGVWLVLIGGYLFGSARRHLHQATLHGVLDGHTVDEAMAIDCPHLPRRLTLNVAAEQIVLPSGRHCFPVLEHGQLLGLLTRAQLEAVSDERWPYVRVEDVMLPRSALTIVQPDDKLTMIFERMTMDGIHHVAVVDHGRLVGMVGREMLLTYIQRHAAVRASGA